MTDRMKTVRFLDRERSANMPAEKKDHLSGRELLEKAAQRYAEAIRRSNPELFEQISWAAT